MLVIKAKLSESGQKRIGAMVGRAKLIVRDSLEKGVKFYMLPEAAKKAPSYEEEKQIIIEGISAEGEKIGYHYRYDLANTFLERRSLRQAIEEDYTEVFADTDLITIHTGHTQDINEKTKLMYQRRSGTIHTSYPFGGKFLEAIEFGGTWEVKPRSYEGNRIRGKKPWPLMPEPEVTTATMFKTAYPYRMYKWALHSNKVRRQIRALVVKDLKKVLK